MGSFSIGIDVDVILLSTGEEMLYAQDMLMTISAFVRHKNREFFLHVDPTLTGVPVGDSLLELTLRDQNSDKSAEVR